MERAAKSIRRSGVKLLSLGGGHTDLNVVISEQKDVRNCAKAFMSAQNSAAQYLNKWASHEDNRAIQDVTCHVEELNMLWTEAQREFNEHLKEFRQMFDMILEGEKHVDHAKNNLTSCEQREMKIKKELKKAFKKSTNDEIRQLEHKLSQAERAKDLAQLEVVDRLRENEAVKTIRFKEGLLRLSEAYVELGKKCAIIFEAQRDIAHQLPDVHDREIDEIKYTGSGATRGYVMQAKERVRQYRRQSHQQHSKTSTEAVMNPLEPPPPYSAVDPHTQDLQDHPYVTGRSPARQQRLRTQSSNTQETLQHQDVQHQLRVSLDFEDLGSDCEAEINDLAGAMGGAKI